MTGQNPLPNSHTPFADAIPIANVRTIGSQGYGNKLEFFFLARPNTIREHATIDLLFPTPARVTEKLNAKQRTEFTRITTLGNIRIIDGGLIRITG